MSTIDTKGTPIFRYLVADYLNVAAENAATPDFRVMNVFEEINESPNAQTTDKHYTGDKSASVITTGYKQQFSANGDAYKDNAVSEYMRDIGEEQKLGIQTDYVRVRLYQPIATKPNTFYARHFLVGFEISNIGGAGGEIMSVEANMNSVRDVVIGEFNTETRTFKSLAELAAASIGS